MLASLPQDVGATLPDNLRGDDAHAHGGGLMGAVWMRARAEMRVQWRVLLSTAILCGLFGAVVLATVAGARRIQVAYPGFLERQLAGDLLVGDNTFFADVFWKPDFERLARLPYVESSARVMAGGVEEFQFFAGTDDRYGRIVNRPVVLKGRLPDPAAPDEIAVPHFADGVLGGFHVGDRKTVKVGKREVVMSVVGETIAPGEFPPSPEFGWNALVSRAFVERYRDDIDFLIPGIVLRFKHRSDVSLFERDVRAMTGGKVVKPLSQEEHTRAVQGSADLQASALRLLALFSGITGLLIIGQTLARETTLASEEQPVLRALGFDRGQFFKLGVVRVVPVAVLGALLAVAVAWLASGLFPRGSIRLADAPTGLRFDPMVMGMGGLAVMASVMVLILLPAWRSAASIADPGPAKPSAIATSLSRAGLPVTAVAGARLALERGRGRTSVPVLSSLAVVTLGVASFLAASTFGTSLSTMLDRPSLHGKTWNGVLNIPEEAKYPGEDVAKALAAEPDVEAVALVDSGAPLRIFGAPGYGPPRGIATLGLTVLAQKGSIFPPVVEGRLPRAPDETVLGARMLRALGLHFDPANPPTVRVTLDGGDKVITMKVVGRAVIPPLGNFGQLGYGIAFADASAIGELASSIGGPPAPLDLIVRWRSGADEDAVVARLNGRFPGLQKGDDLSAGRLSDVVNFGGMQSAPILVGGLLGALGVAALGHVLVTAIRRRRRDIAILKTIGFVRGQARRAVAWQATVMVVVAGAIGIPLGVAGGRWLWSRVAEGLGVIPEPHTDGLVLLGVPLALLLLANIIAAFPGRSAARTKPALVLRSE